MIVCINVAQCEILFLNGEAGVTILLRLEACLDF